MSRIRLGSSNDAARQPPGFIITRKLLSPRPESDDYFLVKYVPVDTYFNLRGAGYSLSFLADELFHCYLIPSSSYKCVSSSNTGCPRLIIMVLYMTKSLWSAEIGIFCHTEKHNPRN